MLPYAFKPSPRAIADRDLLWMKERAGGKVGTITVGGVKAENVLRLDETTFVTTVSPDSHVPAILRVAGADLHVVKSAADVTLFLKRYANFKEA